MKHARLRKAVLETARAMNARGLNQGTSGNVSARAKGGFLVTPSGVPYDELAPSDIVPVAPDGAWVGELPPSSEWRLHAAIYADRAEARAVVHVHSPYATALSSLRIDIPAFHYMVAVAGGADLRCARYATFGTQDLCEAMMDALDGRRACLLANHGMVAFGADLAEALWLAEEVETLCRQYAIARQAGEPAILDAAEMARVLEKFASYGRRPADTEPTA